VSDFHFKCCYYYPSILCTGPT